MKKVSSFEFRVSGSDPRSATGERSLDATNNPKPLEVRIIQPELLDELPPDDGRALRSRRDLRRLNRLMGNGWIMAGALREAFEQHLSFRLVELGAGGGELLLNVARRLRGQWRLVEALLVDQQDLFRREAQLRFASVNWRVQAIREDAFQWLANTTTPGTEAIVTNLFLHQFDENRLGEIFRAAAARAQVLIAIEPRRARWPLVCSRLLFMVGCGAVTRHDAPVSVRAGFAGSELSRLWPDRDNWTLTERPIGLFSHLFIARKRSAVMSAMEGK
jgi:hypothetical protein